MHFQLSIIVLGNAASHNAYYLDSYTDSNKNGGR